MHGLIVELAELIEDLARKLDRIHAEYHAGRDLPWDAGDRPERSPRPPVGG